MAAAKFEIKLSNEGGDRAHNSAVARLEREVVQRDAEAAYYRMRGQSGNPVTLQAASYADRAGMAKQGGFASQLGFGMSEAFSGGPVSGMRQQMALMGMGGAGNALGSLAGASAAFGPVGLAIAGVTMAFDAAKTAVNKFREVVDYFVQRGEMYQRYNGEVAESKALEEIRTIGADMREANMLGEGTSELINAQSRIETSLRDSLLPLKQAVLEQIVPFMNGLAIIMEVVGPQIAAQSEMVIGIGKAAWKMSEFDLKGSFEALVDAADKIKRKLTGEADPVPDLMDSVYRVFTEGKTRLATDDAALRDLKQKMNVPGLKRPQ